MKPRPPAEVLKPALDKARREFAALDPLVAAIKGDGRYHALEQGGEIAIHFWGRDYLVAYPEGIVRQADTGKEPSLAAQIILLHYLTCADGTPPAYRWIAFRDLPDAFIYDKAFRERALDPLAARFGRDVAELIQAAQALGGERLDLGDAAFLFRMFPRLFLAVVLYTGDEEFPSSANILYDASADHYLPAEDLEVLGGMLAGRLIKWPGEPARDET
jgi:hypothetical protein